MVEQQQQQPGASSSPSSQQMAQPQSSEQYTYTAPWMVYSLGWSSRPDRPYRLGFGSFIDDSAHGPNKIAVVHLNEPTQQLVLDAEESLPYPATKVMFAPDHSGGSTDLVATSGDQMRLWEMTPNAGNGMKLKATLTSSSKGAEYCAPLTSFDWCERNLDVLGTSSIDTTCTIWSVETGKLRTQLIAHDKEVYDMAFASTGTDVFASVGADGSVRMFDLRSLEHSTIIYESPDLSPLLRICWNKQDSNYLATFMLDGHKVVVLDIRVPSVPAAELRGHQTSVNSMTWAPHSSCHLCTAGDDKQALIWDLSTMPRPIDAPILHFEAESEINSVTWSALQTDWIAIAHSNKVQTLRV